MNRILFLFALIGRAMIWLLMSALVAFAASESKQAEIPEWRDGLNSLRDLEAKVSITILDEKCSKRPVGPVPKDKFVLWETEAVPPEQRAAAVIVRKALGPEFSAANMEKRFATATAAEKIEMLTLAAARLVYLRPGSVFVIKNDGRQPTIVSAFSFENGEVETFVLVDKIGNFGPESSRSYYIATTALTVEYALALARHEPKMLEEPRKKGAELKQSDRSRGTGIGEKGPARENKVPDQKGTRD